MFKLRIVAVGLLLLMVVQIYAVGVDKDNLKEYGRGIIKDYSDMKEMDEIEWVWLAPQLRLGDHRFKVGPVENLTVIENADMEEVFNTALPKTLQRAGAKDPSAPELHIDIAIYWAQRASNSKRWIPYVGGHLAQAGVGIELVFKNDKDEIVAKIRHSGREGEELKSAAEELVDDIVKFVRAN